MKSLEYILGFVCGLLLVAAIGVVIGIIIKKLNGNKKPEYDERQEAIRGIVFKRAFFTLVIYNIAYGVFDTATGIVWCDGFTAMFIGVALSCTVFVVSSIMKGAYFRMDENPKIWTIIIALIAILNATMGIFLLLRGEIVSDGILQMTSMYLVVSIMFFAILLTIIVKRIRDERGEEREIDE